ncbi:MAG: pyrroline-5-carboxylate reductase [Flavobacteriia bacterium]|nr:pyrroline-5-carboxylate reductase [Flavobacteriia bacterium]
MQKIGIVGCGNLGLSLLNGIKQKSPATKLYGSKRNVASIKKYEDENTVITNDNKALIEACDIIILALKPYTIIPFLKENASYFNANRHTIVSVATGITTTEMKACFDFELDIFRAMPNTASSVNESITAISFGRDELNRTDMVTEIFNSLGETIVIDETLMESATILGACGIAYVLRFMRAMIQGGIEVGFDSKTATKIVSQTVKGAAELIIRNGSHPEEEIDRVTTPKGCTIVGLNEMEHSGFSSALIKGIVTSYQKIEKK